MLYEKIIPHGQELLKYLLKRIVLIDNTAKMQMEKYASMSQFFPRGYNWERTTYTYMSYVPNYSV